MSLNQTLYFAIANFAHRGLFWDSVIVFLAEYLIYFLVLGAILFTVLRPSWRERWLIIFEIALAVIVSRGILTEAIRFFYHHPRPFTVYNFVPLIPESAYSFPSGHTTFIFPIAAILYFYNKRWGAAYFLGGLIIGAARVAAGVHWPFDILGGILIGVGSAYIIHALLRPYRNFKKPEQLPSGSPV